MSRYGDPILQAVSDVASVNCNITRTSPAIIDATKAVESGFTVVEATDEQGDRELTLTLVGRRGSALTSVVFEFSTIADVQPVAWHVSMTVLADNFVATVICEDTVRAVVDRLPGGLFDDESLTTKFNELLWLYATVNARDPRFYDNFDANNRLLRVDTRVTRLDEVVAAPNVFEHVNRPSIIAPFVLVDVPKSVSVDQALAVVRAGREALDPRLADVKTFADVEALVHNDYKVVYVDDEYLVIDRKSFVSNRRNWFVMHDGRPLALTECTALDAKTQRRVSGWCSRRLKSLKRRLAAADVLVD